jgi:penicillin amidase
MVRTHLRGIAVVLGVLSSLLLGVALGLVSWAYRSLPAWSGDVHAAGVAQPIEILRDHQGIPHIFASDEADAYFGLGYAHAQDRLWQMELNRRLASGRLAEVFGPDALERDRRFRAVGLRRAAEASLPHLDDLTRLALHGYVRGVNAFLQQRANLPVEFGLFRVEPEAWSAVDSLVWLDMMAWMLSSNLDTELSRARLAKRLEPRMLAELFAPYGGEAALVLPELGEGLQASPDAPNVTGTLFDSSRAPTTGLGSNNWAVAGSRTQSGKPLLANDPHLALTTPSLWYLAHLHAPGLDVIGATLPGVPGVILGRNDAVAWAFTNTGSDTQDVFIERLASDDAGSYETPDGTRPFSVVREVIHVKGAPDDVLDVRISRHGPVLSGADPEVTEITAPGHVLALRWTALDPDNDTLAFVTHAAHARNADDLEQATRHFVAPPQNVVYADTAGQIGWVAAGRVPLRASGEKLHGLLPVAGWDGRGDWQGYIPFDELPRERNPASGRIVTANQKITPPGYPHWVSAEWADPSRAERIQTLLDATEPHTVETFGAMQLDVQSGSARVLLPRLLELDERRRERLSARQSEWLERLAHWDLQMRAELVEPLVFSAWLREFSRAVYADELGDSFDGVWAERVGFLSNVLSDRAGQARWCDDVRTAAAEECGQLAIVALGAALGYLEERYGADPSRWSWGQAHRARSRHFPMTRVPLLRDWFDLTVESDGGTNTVNVGAYAIGDDEAPFESQHAAGYRAVYDLGRPEASRFLVNGGESGHVLSAHYRDWVHPWQRGELVPMVMERASVEQGGLGKLRISPPVP